MAALDDEFTDRHPWTTTAPVRFSDHVDLGETLGGIDPQLLWVAVSRRDGTETFSVSDNDAREIRPMIAGQLN